MRGSTVIRRSSTSVLSFSVLIIALLALAPTKAATITINDPAYPTTYVYSANPVQSSDLVVLGIYEAHSGHGGGVHPTYDATVKIVDNGPNPLTLVLSSYEPVRWNFQIDPGVVLDQIILWGYHTHQFTGVNSSLVTNKSGFGAVSEPCGYSLPYNGGGCETHLMFAEIENFTGLTISAFAGNYRAADFTVTTGALGNDVTAEVPLPAALPLFLAGIAGIGFAHRRRKN